MIALGPTQIVHIYLGSVAVKLYLGTTLVFTSGA